MVLPEWQALHRSCMHLAAMIDAGLRPKTRAEQRVVLAVHTSRQPGPHPPERWASELECLADLIEMGFTREAAEMADALQVRFPD